MSDDGGRAALDAVIESARHLGVEIDEDEAARWVTALEAEESGRRHRRRRGQRHLRPPRLDARLLGPGPGPLPGDRRDRRLSRPAAHGAHGARALRLGRPGEGPVVPRRLRLLRAGPHQRAHPRRGLRDPGRRHPGEGARDARRADPPPLGSEVRQLPVRRRARRPAGARRDAHLVDGRRGRRRPHRGGPRRAGRARSPGSRPPPSPAGASSTGSWRTRCDVPSRTPATCSTSRGRRPTARSSPSTASSTPTSRRSTSRRSPSRSSPGW